MNKKIVDDFWNSNYIEYESNGDRNATLSIEECLNKIRQYLKSIINDPKKSDTWKIKLTIAIIFISSKGNDEERIMYSKYDNIEFMTYHNANDIVDEHFFQFNYVITNVTK